MMDHYRENDFLQNEESDINDRKEVEGEAAVLEPFNCFLRCQQ